MESEIIALWIWLGVFTFVLTVTIVIVSSALIEVHSRIKDLEDELWKIRKSEFESYWEKNKERRQKAYDDHQRALERIRKLRDQNTAKLEL